ncbi:MAG: hypothetical protein AB1646_02085 [Thermodesulfobacteriota bacterium]
MTEPSAEKAALHWTYREPKLQDDLRQGDVVPIKAALRDLLVDRYAQEIPEEVSHVIVLTQSCDLVRRGSKGCKTSTILIAPVLPLERVIVDQIAGYQSAIEAYAGFCRQSVRKDLRLFLARLLNNNVEDYFYLHPDADVGIVQPSCAYIRLCLGLDAAKYYEHLRQHRTVGLKEPFAHKLGWHMGYLYARVGTEDWVPDHCKGPAFDKMITDLMPDSYPWQPDAKIREADAALSQAARSECGLPASPEEIAQFVEMMPGRSRKDKVLDSIKGVLTHKPVFNDKEICRRVRVILEKDPRIRLLDDPKGLCQDIEEHLAQFRLFVSQLIVDRIKDLLIAFAPFAGLADKDAVLEDLALKLSDTGLFDNDALVNRLCNQVASDAGFKDAVKEPEL